MSVEIIKFIETSDKKLYDIFIVEIHNIFPFLRKNSFTYSNQKLSFLVKFANETSMKITESNVFSYFDLLMTTKRIIEAYNKATFPDLVDDYVILHINKNIEV